MTHPIVEATAQIDAALKDAAAHDPIFMTTGDKATALADLVRLRSRVDELLMRVIAASDDVAATVGARDVAGWLHAQTRLSSSEARRLQRLADHLHRPDHHVVAAALTGGRLTTSQAEVIVAAVEDLPDDIDPETRALAQITLTEYGAQFDAHQLRGLGRRILDIVAPQVAEAAEARRLADLEAHARAQTRLTLTPLGDGTTRIAGVIPDHAATRLATYLWAFTNPKKAHDSDWLNGLGVDGLGVDPARRFTYPKKLGQAFCQLLEAYDPARLPVMAGDATTMMVTVSLDALRSGLATASLVGAADGSIDTITADQARRLACTASIIPAVLDGDGQPLDVGRTKRLHDHWQRKAMIARDITCTAEGCDIPAAYCESHHKQPWTHGGPTSVDDGALLCSHHHHRVHDPAYTHSWQPGGKVTFHRRR